MTKSNTSAGDGRNNADGVAILRRRVFLREITNVLIVHIDVDETAQLSVFGEEVLAQFAEFRGQMAERFSDGPGAELGRVALPRVGAKRRRNHYFHGHFISPLYQSQRPRLRLG